MEKTLYSEKKGAIFYRFGGCTQAESAIAALPSIMRRRHFG